MAFGNRPRGRFTAAMQRLLMGRYGSDKLNLFLLAIGMALTIANIFITLPWLNLALTITSYLLMAVCIFRIFSRNIHKRYRENQRFLLFFKKLRDRKHKYFLCPQCRQQVRVPRGKGKIAITCPRCREKFTKKT